MCWRFRHYSLERCPGDSGLRTGTMSWRLTANLHTVSVVKKGAIHRLIVPDVPLKAAIVATTLRISGPGSQSLTGLYDHTS